jgi:hypothetical protein
MRSVSSTMPLAFGFFLLHLIFDIQRPNFTPSVEYDTGTLDIKYQM